MRMRIATLVACAVVALACEAAAQVGKPVTIVDANVATEQQLTAVPHFTPALVKSVVAGRPFSSITELDALLGRTLSPEQRTAVYGRLFVHLNLNTATREQILLIPNAGPRMVREFQEYRPYKALAQFHREIGKYVDATELARLEQYVFVPIDLNAASDEDIQCRRSTAAGVQGVSPVQVDGAVPARDRQVRGRQGSGAHGALRGDQLKTSVAVA
jgi:DNA uptake protein ComE-like DNA-binding protein